MEAVEIDALATAGPNVDVADLRTPNNVHLVRGAPHDLVMKDVSVVISQGGHGTTTRSLVNGLPQLILPMGRDQAANAARVEAKGAGLQSPPTASEAEIAAAVNRLIAEPQFRKAARLLGEAMKSISIGPASSTRWRRSPPPAARRDRNRGNNRFENLPDGSQGEWAAHRS
ncbi:glycosyltransferase [Bradyrhizobium japonicum]